MKVLVPSASLLAISAALFLHVSVLGQIPWGPNAGGRAGQPPEDRELRRVVADLDQEGEDAGLLSRADAMRAFSDASVESLLAHNNRYIKALAIVELAERRDTTPRSDIRTLFNRLSLGVRDLHRDPHDGEPLSPDGALMAASAEYLAAVDQSAFLPSLLSRAETWLAPHWFVPAFRQLGPGWIRSSLTASADPDRRSALGLLIGAAAMAPNIPELQEVLQAPDSGVWASAVVACERLDEARCWTALEASLDAHDGVDRLKARMAQWRKRQTSAERLFDAAHAVAERALSELPGPARAQMVNGLYQFVRLTLGSQMAIPPSLAGQLRALRSPVISRELAAARID